MNDLNQTPLSSRFIIGIFGKQNVGKSSLINALTGQEIAVTSEIAGTTTDPIFKNMELLPLGPITFVDTAGLDDISQLGEKRIEKTNEILRKVNMAILVVSHSAEISQFEIEFVEQMKKADVKTFVVVNKSELRNDNRKLIFDIENKLKTPYVLASARLGFGIDKIKDTIIENASFEIEPELFDGIVDKNELVVLVTPIDNSAPKGRLILPQQQAIRNLLDKGNSIMISKDTELEQTLKFLSEKPKLVVTDSQAFKKVDEILKNQIPLTSFSILFARQKGDLQILENGAKKIFQLEDGDKVLIAEGCTHHRKDDDIGTHKIPKLMLEKTQKKLEFEWSVGSSFPKYLDDFKLIVHCGGCMLNRKEMNYRISQAQNHGIAITNYGMALASLTGILDKAMTPFQNLKE